jgi:hypothetical protein
VRERLIPRLPVEQYLVSRQVRGHWQHNPDDFWAQALAAIERMKESPVPIKWKNPNKFKPAVVLARVDKVRTVENEGASFAGFSAHQDAATLYSMLDFPDVASETDKPALVWNALAKARLDLTPATFIDAINKELSGNLRKKEEKYNFLATMSFNPGGWPKTISSWGGRVELYGFDFPKKFASRKKIIARHSRFLDFKDSPHTYCAIGVSVKAKSVSSASGKALRSLDVLRALLCLEGNPGMQFSLGGQRFDPINVIRLGSFQSLHKEDGSQACDAVWYEPNFRQASIYQFKKTEVVKKNMSYAMRRIRLSRFGKDLAESLVRYVRALDEPDPNTSFLKLWGAFESLLTPNRADYDALVDRCSFLFTDSIYHRQVLMHLREYRNSSVHAGQETRQAKTNCFLLQGYYSHLFWFLIFNSLRFESLAEIHNFLSVPDDLNELKKRRQLYDRAIKFLST